jgi:hypothetical protein
VRTLVVEYLQAAFTEMIIINFQQDIIIKALLINDLTMTKGFEKRDTRYSDDSGSNGITYD